MRDLSWLRKRLNTFTESDSHCFASSGTSFQALTLDGKKDL